MSKIHNPPRGTAQKTATAAEIREYFLEEDMDGILAEIAEKLDTRCTADVCQGLLEDSLLYMSDDELEKITVSQYAALCMAAKQSYIAGFINGTRAHMDFAERRYKALFG